MKVGRIGFSLIELIVATTLLSIIVFAATTFLPDTTRAVRMDEDLHTDTMKARSISELIRSTGFTGLRDLCVDHTTYDVSSGTISCVLYVNTTPEYSLATAGPGSIPRVQLHFWRVTETGVVEGLVSEEQLTGIDGATLADFIVEVPSGNGLKTVLQSSIAHSDGRDAAYNVFVEGTVTDDLGSPLSSTTVTFVWNETSEAFVTQTNSSGRYSFPSGVPKGSYTVVVEKPDHQSYVNANVRLESHAELDFTLPRLFTLRGHITDERTIVFGGSYPVSGATISVSGYGNVQTDDDGYFEIAGLTAGSYQVTISKPGGWVTDGPRTVTVGANHPTHVYNRQLAYRIQVTGSLRDHNNKPVSGAIVTLNSGGGTATTNSSGSFTINNVKPGVYTAIVTSGGHELVRQYNVRIDRNPYTLSFSWDGRATLDGRVTGHNSTALSNVSITLYDGNTRVAGPITSSDGRFSFSLLEPGSSYRLVVSKNGFKEQEIKNIAVGYPKSTRNVTLLPNVTIRVRDGNTNLSGATVRLGSKTPSSASAGTYIFEGITPGTHNLSVSLSGYKPQSRNITVSATGPTTMTIDMEKELIQITGRVVDSGTSTSLSGVEVELLVRDGTSYVNLNPRRQASTNTQGRFSFNNVEPNHSYKLAATASGYQSAEVIVENPSTEQLLAMKSNETIVYIDGVMYRSNDRVIRNAIPGVELVVHKEGTERVQSVRVFRDSIQASDPYYEWFGEIDTELEYTERIRLAAGERLTQFALYADGDDGYAEAAYYRGTSLIVPANEVTSVWRVEEGTFDVYESGPSTFTAYVFVESHDQWDKPLARVSWEIEGGSKGNVERVYPGIVQRYDDSDNGVVSGRVVDPSKLQLFSHNIVVEQVSLAERFMLYGDGYIHGGTSCAQDRSTCTIGSSFISTSGTAALLRGASATVTIPVGNTSGNWNQLFIEWESISGPRSYLEAQVEQGGAVIGQLERPRGTFSRRVDAIPLSKTVDGNVIVKVTNRVGGNNNGMEARIYRIWLSE